jgi:predicted transcriptional regulator of viral defense system
MKKIVALQILQKSKRNLFSLSDIKKLLRIESDNTAYIQVNRLVKGGLLVRLSKGNYCLKGTIPMDFEVANFMYRPSYISLETALSHYGILIQVPHTIISVTPNRAKKIETFSKKFSYHHINQKYFMDFIKIQNFLIATPEKALIDTIFFASYGRTNVYPDEWVLRNVNKKKLKKLAEKIESKIFQEFFKTLKIS